MPVTTDLVGREAATRNGKRVIRRRYAIEGASDEVEALDQLEADTPTTLGTDPVLYRQNVDVEETDAEGLYEGSVEYGIPGDVIFGETGVQRTFSGSAYTLRLFYSLATVQSTPGAPYLANAIHKNQLEDHPGGVDIESGDMVMTLEWIEPKSAVDTAFVTNLESYRNTVNTDTFQGFAAGTVRFVTYNVRDQGDYSTRVSLSFALSPNVTNQTVAGFTGINKKGHEYAWVYEGLVTLTDPVSEEQTETIGPKAVYVEQVYPTAAFSGLNIPT